MVPTGLDVASSLQNGSGPNGSRLRRGKTLQTLFPIEVQVGIWLCVLFCLWDGCSVLAAVSVWRFKPQRPSFGWQALAPNNAWPAALPLQIRTEEMDRLAENGIAVESWSSADHGRWRAGAVTQADGRH